jgi:hypothetical protein
VLSPLVVFTLIEAATLCAAFLVLLPQAGAGGDRLPRHTTHSEPSSLELNGTL